jgi:hypothetical protein
VSQFPVRHCERSEAIQGPQYDRLGCWRHTCLWPLDCFVARAPRNDGWVAADPIDSVVIGRRLNQIRRDPKPQPSGFATRGPPWRAVQFTTPARDWPDIFLPIIENRASFRILLIRTIARHERAYYPAATQPHSSGRAPVRREAECGAAVAGIGPAREGSGKKFGEPSFMGLQPVEIPQNRQSFLWQKTSGDLEKLGERLEARLYSDVIAPPATPRRRSRGQAALRGREGKFPYPQSLEKSRNGKILQGPPVAS